MQRLILGFALAGAALAAPLARADDRPFLRTVTAVVEDDDERVFEFSATGVGSKQGHELGLQGGYSISPTLSVEAELGWSRDREEHSTERQIGVGIWHAWVDPAREGWGLAGKLGSEWDQGAAGQARQRTLRGIVAASLPLLEKRVWLHANLGVEQRSGDGQVGLWSVAAQANLTRHWQLFAEAADNERREGLSQIGVRHWIRRDKIALDLAIGREHLPGDQRGFVAAGLAFYDLSW